MSDEIRPFLSDDPDARWDAIARHVAGESEPAESAAVQAWLTAHPEDAALAALVKTHADRTERRSAVAVDTEGALAKVRARMTEAPVLTVELGGVPRRAPVLPVAAPQRRWRGVGFAAAAGLVAIVGLSQWRASRPVESAREYRTAVGQRDSVRLPDGTTVVLAPGSHLTVAANYTSGPRDVTLEGAAFFEVQHDAAHPFTVHTATADIRDIGTAFSVKTASSGVSVAVTHGIVSVGVKSSGATELRAGDRATLSKGTVLVQRGVVTAEDVSWTRGQLAYRDAPLTEVQADLQRWYGLDLRVTDSTLAARTLTATFRGDSASQVVHLIALALGADAVQKGDTIYLQPQGSGSPTP